MIETINLTLTRRHNVIIDNVCLTLKSGQITGVLGVNGAGKSTLLSGICGNLAPTSGQILLHDKPLEQWPLTQKARYLAVLPQHFNLNFAFLTREVIELGRLPHQTTHKQNNSIIDDILHLTGIEHLALRNYMELSGGEKQRVQLARILAQLWPITEHSVLLLDEPTAMLDPLYQHNLLKTVTHCAQQGATVMIILHDLNLAARYCGQLLLLNKGHIFKQGTPHDILTTENINAIFGLDVFIHRHPEQNHPFVIPK